MKKKVNEITVKQIYDLAYRGQEPFVSWKNDGFFATTNILTYLVRKQMEDSDEIGMIDIYMYLLHTKGLELYDLECCAEEFISQKKYDSFDVRLYKVVDNDDLFEETRKAFKKLPDYVLKKIGLDQSEYNSGSAVNYLPYEMQDRLLFCTDRAIYHKVFEAGYNLADITDNQYKILVKQYIDDCFTVRKQKGADEDLIEHWTSKLGITLEDIKDMRDAVIKSVTPEEVFMIQDYLLAKTPATSSKKAKNGRATFSVENLKEIDNKVIGQEYAIKKIKSRLLSTNLGFRQENQPIASFLLTGPTGVGKTETAKAIADTCFDGKLFVTDMTTFKSDADISRLLGGSPNYVGYNDKNNFCDFVKENPNCVILFDEVEKAHEGCLDLVMRILDEGQSINAKGEVISFENAVIFCTTNLTQNKTPKIGFGSENESAEEAVTSGIGFKKEIVGRFSEVIEYKPLEKTNGKLVAKKFLDAIIVAFEKHNENGIKLTYDKALLDVIVEKANIRLLGARDLKKTIQSEFINRAVEYISTHRCAGATLCISADGVKRVPKSKQQIKKEVVATHNDIPETMQGKEATSRNN